MDCFCTCLCSANGFNCMHPTRKYFHLKTEILGIGENVPMSSLFLTSKAMFRRAVATAHTTRSLSIRSSSTRMGRPFSFRTAARIYTDHCKEREGKGVRCQHGKPYGPRARVGLQTATYRSRKVGFSRPNCRMGWMC